MSFNMSLKTCAVVLAMMVGTGLAVPPRNCSTTPPPPTTCQEPANQTTGYPDYNKFCACSPYTEMTAWGNPYLGLVHCDTKCAPAKDSQREQHNDKADSLDSCKNACTGSFEKAKRQDGEYWFCHGVNFVKGELCEFIGQKGELTFESGSGSHCLYIDTLDT